MKACAIFVLAAACGGARYPSAAPAAKPAAPGERPRGVEAAALPYHVLDRAGHQLDDAALWKALGAARVVCVGEEHPNPHHHWVQLEVVRHLGKLWPHLALGMEMFQRPFQGVLDDFAAKRIDEAALRSRAGWDDRWGYDFALYRPIIAAALDAHGALIALNAPKELTKKVVHHGLESLAPDEKAQVPDLDLKDAVHRAWFDALMEDMGGSAAHGKKPSAGAADDMPSADRVYTVQVIWDETMADGAVQWIAKHPGARVVILAGNGHCHDHAIVGRIKRRGIADAVSIRSVIDDGKGSVAEALAKPMNDFLVVLDLPPEVKARMAAEPE